MLQEVTQEFTAEVSRRCPPRVRAKATTDLLYNFPTRTNLSQFQQQMERKAEDAAAMKEDEDEDKVGIGIHPPINSPCPLYSPTHRSISPPATVRLLSP